MIYPLDFESKIGFDSIRNCVADKCQSSLGKREAAEMKFSTDCNYVMNRLHSVKEMVYIINEKIALPLGNISDVIPYLAEIRAAGSFMTSERLVKLRGMLQMMAEISCFFSKSDDKSDNSLRFPYLKQDLCGLSSFPELVRLIDSCVNKYGEVKDSASPELYDIRARMRSASGSIQSAMRRVLSAAIAQGIIDKDAAPSMRDGRMVIPVAAGNKRGIPGIIHDESATGKTVYIEPSEVVEAGNRLRELEMEERREIVSILMGIADAVRPKIDEIIGGCRLIGLLDFIRAKAQFAIEVDGQMPHIEDKRELEWYHAVHPGLFLALRNTGRSVVPLTLTLDSNHRILIISGPNAGGKSVCLKTVAVVQYMMQCGLLPTLYYNSHMGIFKNLFIDIGDEQSFENDLSTYSSHLKNMKFFLQNANDRTLLLADEMGSGTEPQIGGALAQSILQSLGEYGCMGVVTTHYQNLKSFADSEPGFENGAMLYDRQHLQPTYELSVGTAGSSFALDIAFKIGLPQGVIEGAKNIVGSEYVNIDKYLSEITRDRRYWANKRQNIREKEVKLDQLLSNYEETAGDLLSKRKEILNEAKREAKEILKGANAQIERTILEIRNAQAEKERTKQLRADLNEFKTNIDSNKNDEKLSIKKLRHKSKQGKTDPSTAKTVVAEKKEIAVGDYVKMKDSNSVGSVISINGKKAEVAFGALRTIVAVNKLENAKKPKQGALTSNASISTQTSDESRLRQLKFRNEIDVRGMRADEAIQAVTYFIDDAIQFSASRVRILHGTGHGILKTLIREQLRANLAVKSYTDEDVRFGGAGITVVDLA